MIIPKFLNQGDTIGITAPSDGIDKEVDLIRLENAKKILRDKGLPVLETPNVRNSRKGRSGSARDRAKEWMDLVENPNVKAIVAVKGGEFLMEMLPYIDYESVQANPKWMQGYSDVTGILFTVTTISGVATLYGNNFKDFGMEGWHSSIHANYSLLRGENPKQVSFDRYEDGFHDKVTGLEGYVLEKPVRWQNARGEKKIRMEGIMLGGCLDVLLNLVGTRFDHVNEFISREGNQGILWYLESYSLSSESIERGLWQLKEAGWFEKASGFVFGRPAMFESYTDTTYREAVLNAIESLNLPIILEADIGHKAPRLTVMNGAYGLVESSEGKGYLMM